MPYVLISQSDDSLVFLGGSLTEQGVTTAKVWNTQYRQESLHVVEVPSYLVFCFEESGKFIATHGFYYYGDAVSQLTYQKNSGNIAYIVPRIGIRTVLTTPNGDYVWKLNAELEQVTTEGE